MVESMRDIGKMVNNMVKDKLLLLVDKSKQAIGKMVRSLRVVQVLIVKILVVIGILLKKFKLEQ